MKLPTITVKPINHHKQLYWGLFFKYNDQLIAEIKKLPGRRWSPSKKCWHIPYRANTVEGIATHFQGKAQIILDRTPPLQAKTTNTSKPTSLSIYKTYLSVDTQRKIEMVRKKMATVRFSQSTIKTYTGMLESFFGYFKDKSTSEITSQDIESYNYNIVLKNGYSAVYQRQLISALKLFYNYFTESEIVPDDLVRPKQVKKLPTILSKEEILGLLVAAKNLKHCSILAFLYSSGLRVSELINLKLKDIDFDRMQIIVRMGKGRKDRVVALSTRMLGLLRNYINTYKPDTYLYNGQKQLQYTGTSIRKVMKRAAESAGIKKHVTPHTLRHSYATHLLESGVDLKYVQDLLGHSKPETTQIYLHLSNDKLLSVRSPLDTLPEGIEEERKLRTKGDNKFLITGE